MSKLEMDWLEYLSWEFGLLHKRLDLIEQDVKDIKLKVENPTDQSIYDLMLPKGWKLDNPSRK